MLQPDSGGFSHVVFNAITVRALLSVVPIGQQNCLVMSSNRMIIAFVKKASLISTSWFVGYPISLANTSHKVWIRDVLP